jgi:hypothetical protein
VDHGFAFLTLAAISTVGLAISLWGLIDPGSFAAAQDRIARWRWHYCRRGQL